MFSQVEYKKKAGEFAVEKFVRSGMVLGLGHGSTAIFALRHIANLIKSGQLTDIQGIPCSNQVQRDAQLLGIPLTAIERHKYIDITIDGADEVDPMLNLIKGGGGALLREKIIAQITKQEIIVVDRSKLSEKLGTNWAVPVEIIPFGWQTHLPFFEDLGAQPTFRLLDNGEPYTTDHGNYLIDIKFNSIDDPPSIANKLKKRAGVVEHGLFLGLADLVISAGPAGIEIHTRREKSI